MTRHLLDMRMPTTHRPADDVARWRCEQLARAGFSAPLAARVAEDGSYDVHALLELVGRGCPPELAVRITAPLDGEV